MICVSIGFFVAMMASGLSFPRLKPKPSFLTDVILSPFPTLHYVKIYVNFSLYGWKPFQNMLPGVVISLEFVLLVCRSVGNVRV